MVAPVNHKDSPAQWIVSSPEAKQSCGRRCLYGRKEDDKMNDSATMVATIIPVFSLTVALVIIVVAMMLKSKADSRRHKERMLLVEKGLEIPSQLYDQAAHTLSKPNGFRAGRAWLLVFGCTLVFVGLGVVAFGAVRGDHIENGLVPFFIGLGFLASERLIARLLAKPNKE
jgi:hypothetical protein